LRSKRDFRRVDFPELLVPQMTVSGAKSNLQALRSKTRTFESVRLVNNQSTSISARRRRAIADT
jgi:hypothetical protein